MGKGNEVRCADLQDLKARQPTSALEGYRQFKVQRAYPAPTSFRSSVFEFGFLVANGDGDRRWICQL